MAFLDIQTTAAIIFLILLTIFVYFKKENMTTQKILYPLFYLSMYRTKFGLKLMDSASRHKKIMKFLGYAGVVVGFLGMVFIAFILVSSTFDLFTNPNAKPSVGPVLPFKGKGIFFVPFFYWIISILIIAFVHEFSHGVITRTHNIKVKSSGFAFFSIFIPIIPLAFVEPDEKEIPKRPLMQQLSVFAAGPFSNFITGALCVLLLIGVLYASSSFVHPNGIKIVGYTNDKGIVYPAEKYKLEGQIIKSIDDQRTLSLDRLSKILGTQKPGNKIKLETNKETYSLILAQHPENSTRAYLGASLEPTGLIYGINKSSSDFIIRVISWIITLLNFMYILNLGVGLFNLVPLGPLDGGRMIKPIFQKIFNEKSDKAFGLISLLFIALIFINLVFAFVKA